MKLLYQKAGLIGIGFFLFFLVVGANCLLANEPLKSKGELKYTIDFGSFWEDTENAFLEVYYKIPYSELQFIQRDKIYQATFDIGVVIYDATGKQIVGKHWQYPVIISDHHELSVSYAYSQIRFGINPGNYKIKIRVEDVNTKAAGFLESSIDINSFPTSAPALGKIQFGEKLNSENPIEAFSKQGRQIIPNPDRHYGENQKELVYYTELYDAQMSGNYQITHRIIDFADSLQYTKNDSIVIASLITPITHVLSVENYADGKYELIIEATNLQTQQTSKIQNEFYISWSPIAWGSDFKETLNQIMYIATPEELKQFKSLKNATQEKRSEFLIEFWALRDPIPSTPQNEYMIEHYRRYKYANENFGGTASGWRTDMGRIYIKFGEPDEIERHPFNFDSRPYEVWIYYKCGYRFIFIDEDGYGRYNLVSPISEEMYNTNCVNQF